jgi:four helix bundle protein
MRNHLHQNVLEHSIEVITVARPLVEAVARRDRELSSQLRRALSSVALNIAEGAGSQGGNARLRNETALGSLYEARAALRVAVAWGYVAPEGARSVLESMNALGARVFGLARR